MSAAKHIIAHSWTTKILSDGPAPHGQAFIAYQFQSPAHQSHQYMIPIEDCSATNLAKVEALLDKLNSIVGHRAHHTSQ